MRYVDVALSTPPPPHHHYNLLIFAIPQGFAVDRFDDNHIFFERIRISELPSALWKHSSDLFETQMETLVPRKMTTFR